MNTYNPVSDNGGSVNKVLSQAYQLLGMTMAFAAVMAFVSMQVNVGMNPIIFLVAYFVNLFLIEKNKNTSLGVVFTFTLTGLLGFTLGPILNYAIASGQEGAIVSSFVSTAGIFMVASVIGRNSEKDYSSLGVFAGIGLLIAFVVSLLNIFIFQMGVLSVIISAAFAVLSSLAIVFWTNSAVRGGERNYISLTVGLFVAIYNIFSSLLHLFLSLGGDE